MGTQDPADLSYYIPDIISNINYMGDISHESLKANLRSEKDDNEWVKNQIDRIRRELKNVLQFHYKDNNPIIRGFKSKKKFLNKNSDPYSMYLEYLVYKELRQLGKKGEHILEKLNLIVAKGIKDKERYASIQSMLKIDKEEKLLEDFTNLKKAIHEQKEVNFLYNDDKYYEVIPIQLINLEYFWYLQCENKENNRIWNAKISRMKEIEIRDSFDEDGKDYSDLLNTSKYAINAFHTPSKHLQQEVILHIHSKIKPSFFELPFFEEGKNIQLFESANPKPDYTSVKVFVSNPAEILIIIQAYQPSIIVESPSCLRNYIKIASSIMLDDDLDIELADIVKLKDSCEEEYGDNSEIVKKHLQ